MVEPLVMVNSPLRLCHVLCRQTGEEVIFASSRSSSAGSGEDPITGESYMDLFSAEVDRKNKWSIPEPLGNTINARAMRAVSPGLQVQDPLLHPLPD